MGTVREREGELAKTKPSPDTVLRRDKKQDERFMREAVKQARKAYALGESPIGCVIVRGDQVVARGYNRRTADHSTLAHAEVIAIRKACKKEGDWRLEGCRMYVTLEPCPMCAGALLQCRMDEVIIGCMSPKSGCAGSVINLLEMDGFNHKVRVTTGVLEEVCQTLMRDFFRELRARLKEEKSAKTALTKTDSESIL